MTIRALCFRIVLLSGVALVTACSGGGASSAPSSSTATKTSGPLLYTLGSNVSPNTSTPPSGVLGVQSLNLTFTGTGQTNAVLAYETSYVGSYTVASSCTNATGAASGTSPATATFAGSTTGSGPGAVLTVTAGATGGTCTFTITDSQNNTAILFVGTSLTGGSIS